MNKLRTTDKIHSWFAFVSVECVLFFCPLSVRILFSNHWFDHCKPKWFMVISICKSNSFSISRKEHNAEKTIIEPSNDPSSYVVEMCTTFSMHIGNTVKYSQLRKNRVTVLKLFSLKFDKMFEILSRSMIIWLTILFVWEIKQSINFNFLQCCKKKKQKKDSWKKDKTIRCNFEIQTIFLCAVVFDIILSCPSFCWSLVVHRHKIICLIRFFFNVLFCPILSIIGQREMLPATPASIHIFHKLNVPNIHFGFEVHNRPIRFGGVFRIDFSCHIGVLFFLLPPPSLSIYCVLSYRP